MQVSIQGQESTIRPRQYTLNSGLRRIFTFVVPFSTARLVQILGDFGNITMLARLGTQIVAASSLITSTQVTVMTPLLSTLNASPIVIIPTNLQETGDVLRQSLEKKGSAFRQSLIASLILSAPAVAIAIFSDQILLLMKQPSSLAHIVREYFDAYMYSIPFNFALYAMQQFSLAIQKPRILLVSTISNTFLTTGAALPLIFGKFGIPAFGPAGLGYANLFGSSLTFVGTTLYFLLRKSQFKDYKFLSYAKETDWSVLRGIFRKGIPIGIFVGTEIMAIFVATVFTGWLGEDVLAVQQAAAAYLYVFTSLLITGSQGVAVAVRIENAQKKYMDVNFIGNLGIGVGITFSILVGGVLCAFPRVLLIPFLGKVEENPHLVLAAETLLRIHGVGLVLDAIRNLATGTVRGLGDTQSSMWVGFISTCVIALSLGYVMGFTYNFAGLTGIKGIYAARDIGLAVGAASMCGIWIRKINNLFADPEKQPLLAAPRKHTQESGNLLSKCFSFFGRKNSAKQSENVQIDKENIYSSSSNQLRSIL
jgi:multidrug resistance protein, MATE family